MIEFRSVTKNFGSLCAVKNISFLVTDGEFVFLTGPSGAGKSTIIRLILGEYLPSVGDVVVKEKSLKNQPRRRMYQWRRSIGVVFQDYKLFPDLTMFENIILPLQICRVANNEAKSRVIEVLKMVGLIERASMFPAQLSGGELQRATLARAIVRAPDILLADEPTGNLDPETSNKMIELLKEINTRGTTVVMATHAKDIVDAFATRVIELKDGQVVRDERQGKYSAPSIASDVIEISVEENLLEKKKRKQWKSLRKKMGKRVNTSSSKPIFQKKAKMSKILKKHLFRSPFKSLAAILIVSSSLFLISIFFFIGIGSQQVLKYFETRPQVTAFLKDEAKPQEIDFLKAKLLSTNKVVKVDYVSKEDALTIYKELFKDKPLLLEMASAKQLPASLDISTTDLVSLSEIAQSVKNETIVEDVDYQADVITSLALWVKTVRQAGLVIGMFLLSLAVLTVLVIIGMNISQRREEMEILKLIGASPWYIRLPYYWEGIIYGGVSALLSGGLTYLVIWYLSPFLTSFFAGITLVPVPTILLVQFFAGLTGIGVLVGLIGSILAVWRFSRYIR